jgi:uncharacterized protein
MGLRPGENQAMVAPTQIREFSRRLAEEYRPKRIVLFGSHAKGSPRRDSDVDLLVVMPFSGNGMLKAAEIIRRLEPGFAVDLLVRTPRQVQRRLAANDFFLRQALADGTVLYEDPHA